MRGWVHLGRFKYSILKKRQIFSKFTTLRLYISLCLCPMFSVQLLYANSKAAVQKNNVKKVGLKVLENFPESIYPILIKFWNEGLQLYYSLVFHHGCIRKNRSGFHNNYSANYFWIVASFFVKYVEVYMTLYDWLKNFRFFFFFFFFEQLSFEGKKNPRKLFLVFLCSSFCVSIQIWSISL